MLITSKEVCQALGKIKYSSHSAGTLEQNKAHGLLVTILLQSYYRSNFSHLPLILPFKRDAGIYQTPFETNLRLLPSRSFSVHFKGNGCLEFCSLLRSSLPITCSVTYSPFHHTSTTTEHSPDDINCPKHFDKVTSIVENFRLVHTLNEKND